MLLILICLPLVQGNAQDDKYSLLTEPFVERPVSMHRGQLQVNGAYQLSVTSGYFENNSEKSDLVEDGRAAVGHRYDFNIHFGILEYLEVGAEMNYFMQGIRSESITYFDLFATRTVTEMTEWNGLEDLVLSATLSLPFEIDMFDLGITGFYSIPVAEHDPPEPEHSYMALDPDGTSNVIEYHFMEKNGIGVPRFGAGGIMKLRLPPFAIQAGGSIMLPQREGETLYWDSELADGEFLYNSTEYPYLPQRKINGSVTVHTQPVGWLQLFTGVNYLWKTGGWFEQHNQRYAYPEFRNLSLVTGFEIMASPKLRIHEYAGFPLYGKNGYADFYIYTGLSFNLITY